MTDTTTSKTRTITLTGRPPVKIREDEWPVIALGSDSEHDGEVESQATRTTTAFIRVRRHADGRALVYGRYEYTSAWRGARNIDERGGVLIAADADVAAAISQVAYLLIEAGADDGMMGRIERECTANLPAEEI